MTKALLFILREILDMQFSKFCGFTLFISDNISLTSDIRFKREQDR